MANKHLWTNTVQYRDQAMVTSLATSTAKTVLEIYYLLLYIIYYILLYITIYYYILYIIYYYILYIYSLIGNTWAKCVANNTLAPRPQGPKAPRPQGSKAPKPQGPKAPRPQGSWFKHHFAKGRRPSQGKFLLGKPTIALETFTLNKMTLTLLLSEESQLTLTLPLALVTLCSSFWAIWGFLISVYSVLRSDLLRRAFTGFEACDCCFLFGLMRVMAGNLQEHLTKTGTIWVNKLGTLRVRFGKGNCYKCYVHVAGLNKQMVKVICR